MIAKRVMRGKAGAFRRLSGYILDPKKLAIPENDSEWRRTAEYVLDIKDGGERSTAARITNCVSDEIEWAIREIELTQQLNNRAKGERTYHLVVSFPPGEQPTPEQLIDIEDELCRAIGLPDHQRISAVHTDTKHLHMHVAINQIHPRTHNRIEPWYDKRKLMAACLRLETKHGLERTNHGINRKKRPAQSTTAMQHHRGVGSLSGWIEEHVTPAIGSDVERAESWQDIHRALADFGLEIKPRGAGFIVKAANGAARVKASSVHKALAKKSLTARFGAFVSPETKLILRGRGDVQWGRPVGSGKEFEQLLGEFRELQQSMGKRRRARMTEIDKWERERNASHRKWYTEMRESIFGNGAYTRFGKEGELVQLDLDHVRFKNRTRQNALNMRTDAQRALGGMTWISFLRTKIADGNQDALPLLQDEEAVVQKAIEAQFNGSAQEKLAAQQEFRPEINDEGETIHHLRDGGKVAIDGAVFRLELSSPLALLMRFRHHIAERPGFPFSYSTKPEWEALAVMGAVAYDQPITFENKGLEKARVRLERFVSGNDDLHAALLYSTERQAMHWQKSDGPEFRLWEPEHTGKATIEEIVTLRTGSRAVLLEKDKIVFIKPCSVEEAELLERELGETVSLDRDGVVTKTRKKARIWAK